MNSKLGMIFVIVCFLTSAHAQFDEIDCPIGPFHCGPPTDPVPDPIGPFEPAPPIPVLSEIQEIENYLITRDSNNSLSFEKDVAMIETIERLSEDYNLEESTLYRIDPSVYSSNPAAEKYLEKQLFFFNK